MGRKDREKKLQKAKQQQQKTVAQVSEEVTEEQEEQEEQDGENTTTNETPDNNNNESTGKYEDSPRSVTGVLASHPLARDVKIINFSLRLGGLVIVDDTLLEFNYGRRYGLIGLNGSGKSTLLTCIGQREVPIPSHIKIVHLDREIAASEKTALESVMEELEGERKRLEQEAEELAMDEDGSESADRLSELDEILEEMDVHTATTRAAKILHGLGFTKEMQHKKTKDFSGGWRMRIALAKALFMKPTILLLDEPTNHLDLEACVWLEEYLKTYRRILVVVSHSQDFLNGVCTNIIHLQNRQLTYYTGNFDTYVTARQEKEVNQMKQFNWEQDQIAHMKDYVARFGHGSAKLASQAKSKAKLISKMEEQGLTERVVRDKLLVLRFADPGTLPPPVVTFNKVSFGYNPNPRSLLYENLEFGIDLDSRVALVGPNGVGKSTLLKLLVGELVPVSGLVRKHSHLRIAWYHQHLTEHLDLSLSPLEFMLKEFPGEMEKERMRQVIGKFGLTGKLQTSPIKMLSDGQKSRVVFAWLAWREPHLLLLDEPTNHLDLETIDSLAEAINNFEGGLVLVSHDFRLINQVAKEIWVCEHKTVTPWKGDILSYKEYLRKRMFEQNV
jgi:ATP-binding cassette subfamily F protein 2